ncbi:hypothetical protein DWB77_03161 [Streptomyces hundungensis]|uniref:Uncharacterized protein n=1 Tax=Streptomyces hundungensis TaxID=1077946 RepID=A0A387HFF1_9ACTN|nr:hypothetical protein DWB77_03161 [Streptomyces hundungensis]
MQDREKHNGGGVCAGAGCAFWPPRTDRGAPGHHVGPSPPTPPAPTLPLTPGCPPAVRAVPRAPKPSRSCEPCSLLAQFLAPLKTRFRLRAAGGWARSSPRPWQDWCRPGRDLVAQFLAALNPLDPADRGRFSRSSPRPSAAPVLARTRACPAIEDERRSGANGGAGGGAPAGVWGAAPGAEPSSSLHGRVGGHTRRGLGRSPRAQPVQRAARAGGWENASGSGAEPQGLNPSTRCTGGWVGKRVGVWGGAPGAEPFNPLHGRVGGQTRRGLGRSPRRAEPANPLHGWAGGRRGRPSPGQR